MKRQGVHRPVAAQLVQHTQHTRLRVGRVPQGHRDEQRVVPEMAAQVRQEAKAHLIRPVQVFEDDEEAGRRRPPGRDP